ncbi:sulfotransferase [Microbacterium lacticum]
MTGMPRSGTTWLSRLLATAPGTALTGREPMNPRERQWALAGSLDGWTRLRDPNGKQARALRRAYRGLAPGVYSSFGFRQWRGPLPNSRLIVKDPFAMLSMPAIHTITGARPVLVYRHPGAMLVSYRRMGWAPDVAELRPHRRGVHPSRRPDGRSDPAVAGRRRCGQRSRHGLVLVGALCDRRR